jgi:hypothetical protein
MDRVIETIEGSLRAKNAGQLIAPPRFSVDVEKGALVFTAGAETMESHTIGFRVYDSFQSDAPERTQLVAVFSAFGKTVRERHGIQPDRKSLPGLCG